MGREHCRYLIGNACGSVDPKRPASQSPDEMHCRIYSLFLALSVLFLVGCAQGPEIAQPPTRLSEVNRVLETADATIVWVSGDRVKDAEYVRVSPDSIRYRLHTDPGAPDRWARTPQIDETTRSRSIHEVQRIVAHVGGGGGLAGLAVGAAPGLFLFGTSALSCRSSCGLGAALGLYYGGLIGLAGGLLGAIVGELADNDRRAVYQGPVDQYVMR